MLSHRRNLARVFETYFKIASQSTDVDFINALRFFKCDIEDVYNVQYIMLITRRNNINTVAIKPLYSTMNINDPFFTLAIMTTAFCYVKCGDETITLPLV